jgi:hypothetical protein
MRESPPSQLTCYTVCIGERRLTWEAESGSDAGALSRGLAIMPRTIAAVVSDPIRSTTNTKSFQWKGSDERAG